MFNSRIHKKFYTKAKLCLFSIILIIGMIFVFLLSCERKAKTSKSYAGIKRYWPSRDDALNEIKSRMLDSRNIFISGIALRSISPILGNPDVIKQIESNARKSSQIRGELKITLVVLLPISGKAFEVRNDERTRSLYLTCYESLQTLQYFKQELSNLLKDDDQMEGITFKFYSGLMPRHFIMKADDRLYVGSYFSYRTGGSSYVIELDDMGEGYLYHFFDSEIDYILDHSEEFDPGAELQKLAEQQGLPL